MSIAEPIHAPRAACLSEASIARCATDLHDVLTLAIEHNPAAQRALIVADRGCPLSETLTEAYRRCLPTAQVIDFEAMPAASILAAFAALSPHDLVVLIQSSNFRLDAYRIRVELFKRGLKVIEHPHLGRMIGDEALIYLDALAYDRDYYRGTGLALKARIDRATSACIDSDGALLHFGALEPAKINLGDYRGMANVGGQFPIGEVFTEARDLHSVHGAVRLFVFGDTAFAVNRPPSPITLHIKAGKVTAVENSTTAFDQVLANIRADEGEVWLRELGFGMNRALSASRRVSDIGTFERMCGIHLSLGAKHGVYAKPGFKRGAGRHHVDVFAATRAVFIDAENVFQDGRWLV